jgi:farnesyl diphosphate synthase
MAQDFGRLLAARAEAVERELEAILSGKAWPGEIARPPRLLAAMRHAALDGGKRLRPFLVIETARLLGAEGAGALRAGCALELAHCYSLVHDDLPAMDDDDLRRGRPTVHKAFDEATAILAGDGLLTLAFDVIGDAPTDPDPAVRAALVVGLARAAGLGGMAGGQMFDLEAETAREPLERAATERMQAMKTGALLHFAVDAGAILGRASAPQRQALGAYGRALGAAFQVADDILDAEGDEAQLGKRAGKDAGRQKATLVALLGVAGAKRVRDDMAAKAEAALARFGPAADVLRAAARFTVHRAY